MHGNSQLFCPDPCLVKFCFEYIDLAPYPSVFDRYNPCVSGYFDSNQFNCPVGDKTVYCRKAPDTQCSQFPCHVLSKFRTLLTGADNPDKETGSSFFHNNRDCTRIPCTSL